MQVTVKLHRWSNWAATRKLREANLPEDDINRKSGTRLSIDDIEVESGANLDPDELTEPAMALGRLQERRRRWNIETLQQHAEDQAKCWRRRAVVPAIVAGAPLLIAAIMSWFIVPEEKSIPWMIGKLSVLLILAAVLILLARILWNYSNVWLGRAGMLEDLGLALTLIGKPPTGETPLAKNDTQSLLEIAQSLERLRRVFEGDLLKGPQLEVPKVSTK